MEQFFSFYGLASRSEYWGVVVVTFVVAMFLSMAATPLFLAESTMALGFVMLAAMFVIASWLMLATTARRCRDAGINPWWAASIIIPYIGFIPSIVFGIIPTETIIVETEE